MRVVDLCADDADIVQRLFADDGGYCRRVAGRQPEASDALVVLTERPPGVPATAKHVLGLSDGADLVALADVIRGWPTVEHAHVGLLQTAATRHRRGVGRALHRAVEERVATWPEVTTLRLAVVDRNREVAEPFWRAMGYGPTGETRPFASGTVRSVARIWTRPVLS
ncbi:GNAT family N-acetyltransferase [Isoptericola halotolerans]|uniref:GNAT family N-acetyltransferase n=1 Tax=Isoptericola halotolerans TaxID=300560 RepID=UPI00388D7D1C